MRTASQRFWNAGVVSSYAVDDGERLLLFDPLAPPSEIDELAADRETAVVLTAPWHERDTQILVERLGLPVNVPPPDTEDDLMQKFGITREQAAGGSPDVAWLLAGDGGEAHLYRSGERLAVGVDAFAGREPNDMVLWIEGSRAVISGDTLVDFGRGRRDQRVAARRRDARAGRRGVTPAGRPAGRRGAGDAWRADRPNGARARALLTLSSPPRNPRCRCGSVAVVDELLPEQTWHRGAFMKQSGRNR
jgi:glyoxylase-like metal-dependent hydrolase (beta-lactamase superfamily II)